MTHLSAAWRGCAVNLDQQLRKPASCSNLSDATTVLCIVTHLVRNPLRQCLPFARMQEDVSFKLLEVQEGREEGLTIMMSVAANLTVLDLLCCPR